ncbi:MAG: hypothetical protein CVT60_03310 [Actinobacteria bacterium HGW-Actinobacteria-10]|nr:MAG: hypothetical protein CVT60_03310 [Actinobacteria bacterium HGW-Actinobacteria-10]
MDEFVVVGTLDAMAAEDHAVHHYLGLVGRGVDLERLHGDALLLEVIPELIRRLRAGAANDRNQGSGHDRESERDSASPYHGVPLVTVDDNSIRMWPPTSSAPIVLPDLLLMSRQWCLSNKRIEQNAEG